MNYKESVNMQAGEGTTYFDGMKLTPRHYMMFFLILLGTFFDQMDLYNMSFVGPALIKNWGFTLENLALVNSVMIFTMLFGGLFGGYVSDRLGRKTSLLTGVFIFSVFSICNGLAWNFVSFLVSRAITGFGIAMLVCTEGTYMSEITPSEVRGRWISITFGCSLVAAPLTAFFAKAVIPMFDFGWRLVFFVGGLGFVIFALGLKYLSESPRWLATKGRYEEAKASFKTLTGQELAIDPASIHVEEKASWIETMHVLLSKNYIRSTIVCSIFLFFIGSTAAFMFISWAPTLLTKHGFDLAVSLQIGSIIALGMPMGGIVGAALAEKWGRKIPLGGLIILYGIFAFIFAQLTNPTYIMVFGFLMATCHMAYFSMTASYVPENYPTYVRGTSFAIIYLFSRVGPAIGNIAVPILFAAVGYTGYFNVAGAMFLVAGLVVMIFGRSTAGHNLEELHKEWDDKCKNRQRNSTESLSEA